jgi:hypothetical protein
VALPVALLEALPWHAREALAPLAPLVPVPIGQGVQATAPKALDHVSGAQGRQESALVALLKLPGGQRGRGWAGLLTSRPVGQAAPAGQLTQVKPQDKFP